MKPEQYELIIITSDMIKIVHMNRHSLTIQVIGREYTCFISRRIFNLLMKEGQLECKFMDVFDVKSSKIYTWLAAVCVF